MMQAQPPASHHYDYNHRLLLVSDVHIQDDQDPLCQKLLSLLEKHVPDVRAVYILGDLFDYWAGDQCHLRYRKFLHQILKISQKCPVFMMPGNRDFLISRQRLCHYGIQKISDPLCITHGQQHFLLTHGDQLCIHDTSYQRLRRIIQHPFVVNFIQNLPYSWCLRSCQHMRKQSQRSTRTKPAHIMQPDRQTMQNWLTSFDAATLIFGHVHQLQTIILDPKIRRALVMDSWEHQANYCLISPDGAQLYSCSTDF